MNQPQSGKPDFSKTLRRTLKRYQRMPGLCRVMKYCLLFILCSPGLIILSAFLKIIGIPLPDMATIHVLMECALMLDGIVMMFCIMAGTILLSLPRAEDHDERYFAQPGEAESKSDLEEFRLPEYWRLYLPGDFGTRELLLFIVLAFLPAFVLAFFLPQPDVSPLRDFWGPFRALLIGALALLASVNLSRGLFLLISRLRCYRTKNYQRKKE